MQENDYAGYVMAHVGGDGWRGNFGVRLVDTDENAFINVPTGGQRPARNPGDIFSRPSARYSSTTSHITTSTPAQRELHVRPAEEPVLRVSAAETMSRPDYSALGGDGALTDLTLTGNGGNPNLKPVKAAVYDAALEWYYAPTAVAAVSLFYDDLSSYVAFGTSTGISWTSSCRSRRARSSSRTPSLRRPTFPAS